MKVKPASSATCGPSFIFCDEKESCLQQLRKMSSGIGQKSVRRVF